MSTSTTLRPYDAVFDSQKHYRVLLNCTARPGTLGLLDDVRLEVPAGLSHAMALVSLALFSGEVPFFLLPGSAAAVDFVRHRTQAYAVSAPEAEFLLLEDAAGAAEAIQSASTGSLEFPETGATVVLQVASLSPAPLNSGLKLTLTGPGIETESTVFVAGISATLLELLRARNREFPLGIDVILACDSLSAGPCILSLPRTTNVHWDSV